MYSFVFSQGLAKTGLHETGWYGCKITSALSDPPTVTSLGRFVVSGNKGKHAVCLIRQSDMAVIASAVVDTKAAPVGSFSYSKLLKPVTLQAWTAYYLLSQEDGADAYGDSPVSTTAIASVDGSVGGPTLSKLTVKSGNEMYGPLSFRYLGRTCTCESTMQSANRATRSPGQCGLTVRNLISTCCGIIVMYHRCQTA